MKAEQPSSPPWVQQGGILFLLLGTEVAKRKLLLVLKASLEEVQQQQQRCTALMFYCIVPTVPCPDLGSRVPRCCHAHDCCYKKLVSSHCNPKMVIYLYSFRKNQITCGKSGAGAEL